MGLEGVAGVISYSQPLPQNVKSPPKNTTSPPIATGDIFSPALTKLVPVANPPESFELEDWDEKGGMVENLQRPVGTGAGDWTPGGSLCLDLKGQYKEDGEGSEGEE
ncbi:hypothetical protein BELL_0026g00220 [Botrytis elliptica]|uniref:Uncharacterized protein n=1 Tax=Botrytis elliptica TaxID=278938 RepID=A0A4Z1K2E4_9HELO|nr:hypothetical protein BELL_0026g00220 [Botrytis elliptica]